MYEVLPSTSVVDYVEMCFITNDRSATVNVPLYPELPTPLDITFASHCTFTILTLSPYL